MPRIIAAAHALPRHIVPQSQIKEMMERVFAGRVANLSEVLQVFDNARIDRRQFVMPPEWYLAPQGKGERNRVYLTEGKALLRRAAERCLSRAGLQATEIDHLICVSSTGHATPSLDARLIDELGFAPETTRMPLWGLGCAAGAAGLARAFDHCRAYPRSRVLLIALECCSLTFRDDDSTRKNLIGTALFADGAAAAIVAGAESGGNGPRIVARCSHLFPDTARIMGWDFDDAGMQLVLSPRLPGLIRTELPGLVGRFLRAHARKVTDIVHFVTHPGGAKVIDAYREALELRHQELALSEKSLREHGNVSSVSVLMVLEEWLATRPESRPGPGLLSAFGPGFSAEMLLLEV